MLILASTKLLKSTVQTLGQHVKDTWNIIACTSTIGLGQLLPRLFMYVSYSYDILHYQY
jgi:hypothetical protein